MMGYILGLYDSFPKIRGPQYRPQHTIVLIIGTPKTVPLMLGNPHVFTGKGLVRVEPQFPFDFQVFYSSTANAKPYSICRALIKGKP